MGQVKTCNRCGGDGICGNRGHGNFGSEKDILDKAICVSCGGTGMVLAKYALADQEIDEDWLYIGEMMAYMRNQGYYPGVGYDSELAEAWVFDEEPLEGVCQKPMMKTSADTITAAIAYLVSFVPAKHVDTP